ncbi:MAG TPA: zf-HC2 domain-containing protein [Planctomycetaceae bacterium]|nr:zf-HC2 domain-containing protein [Planctomycetaceae bacterium]
MNCRDVKPELLSIVYNELPADRRGAVEAHLARCESCRRELDGLHQGRRLLDVLRSDVEVPALDTRRLFHEAARRAQRQRRRWKWLAVASTAAAAAAVLVLWAISGLTFDASPGRLTVTWGQRPPSAPAGAASPVHNDELPAVPTMTAELADRLAAHERDVKRLAERVQSISELAHLATRELLAVDRRHSDELSRLRTAMTRLGESTTAALDELREQSDVRWKLLVLELARQPELNAVSAIDGPAEGR